MSRALIIELLLTALYLTIETEKSFMDCNFWHKLCCWGRTHGCSIAAGLVVSAAGAILDRERTREAFAFLLCLGVCRRCGWPQDKETGWRGRRVRKAFLPHPLGWFVRGEGRGKPWAGELAKVIGIIFDATLEECENLFYTQLLGDMNCVPPWGLLVCVTGIQISWESGRPDRHPQDTTPACVDDL